MPESEINQMKNETRNNFTHADIRESIQFAFAFLWENERRTYFYIALCTVPAMARSFINILFLKYLLDSLSDMRFAIAVAVLTVYCLAEFLLQEISDWASIKKSECLQRVKILQKSNLMKKLASLRYEQMEASKILDQYEFTQKCIEKGSIEVFAEGIFSICSQIAVIGGVIYILRSLPLWALVMITGTVVLNTVGHIAVSRNTYEEMSEETPVERQLYYFRGRVLNQEYGKEIRAFQLVDYFASKLQNSIEEFFRLQRRYTKTHNKILWWTYLAGGVQTFVAYAYNAFLFGLGEITVGTFTMNISALLQVGSSLDSIAGSAAKLSEHTKYLRDYRAFFLMSGSWTGEDFLPEMGSGFTIEFQDVSFHYQGQEQYALSGLNVKIRANEKISIVGMNGAGKTTFVKLLMGMYKPTAGKILLNGVDIETLEYEQYAAMFAVIFQDYQIYSFTVGDNLMFEEKPTQDQCSRAESSIRDSGLESTVGKLSGGIHSYLTERYDKNGISLSGGEQQKLAIARVLYKDAPVMILDEPTSALSPQSEYDIYKRFHQISAGKTVLFISHRLSSCTFCDRILVFENGHVAEDGTHADLMKENGLYKELFDKQASFYVGAKQEA